MRKPKWRKKDEMVQVLLFWILGLLVGEKWKKEGELITCLVEPISLGELG